MNGVTNVFSISDHLIQVEQSVCCVSVQSLNTRKHTYFVTQSLFSCGGYLSWQSMLDPRRRFSPNHHNFYFPIHFEKENDSFAVRYFQLFRPLHDSKPFQNYIYKIYEQEILKFYWQKKMNSDRPTWRNCKHSMICVADGNNHERVLRLYSILCGVLIKQAYSRT